MGPLPSLTRPSWSRTNRLGTGDALPQPMRLVSCRKKLGYMFLSAAKSEVRREWRRRMSSLMLASSIE